MSVHYPSHLYIRIDRPLRADLLAGAEAAGQTVSEFARGLIRSVIARRPESAPSEPAAHHHHGSRPQRGGAN